MLDGRTGQVLGTFTAEGQVERVAVNEYTGHIVVLSDTKLYILNERTAAPLHTLTLPTRLVDLAMDDQGSRIFVVQQADPTIIPQEPMQLIVFDGNTGTLLRRFQLHSWGSMVVFSQTRRVFVSSGADDPFGMRFVRVPKIWTIGY